MIFISLKLMLVSLLFLMDNIYFNVCSCVCCYSVWGAASGPATPTDLTKVIKKAGSVLGTVLEPLEVIVERRMVHNLLTILDDTLHPLHDLLIRQQSSWSLLQLSCNKDRYFKSFLLIAKKRCNNLMVRERQHNQTWMLRLLHLSIM